MSAVESVIVIGHIGAPGCDDPDDCMVCAKSRLGKERWLILLVCVRCGEKLDTDGALCSACEAADTATQGKGRVRRAATTVDHTHNVYRGAVIHGAA